jgi:hypothetical protein
VFGRRSDDSPSLRVASPPGTAAHAAERPDGLPHICGLILILGGALVVLLGVYLPSPLHELLRLASHGLQR